MKNKLYMIKDYIDPNRRIGGSMSSIMGKGYTGGFKIHSWLGHGGDWRHPVSRDYQEIDCNASSCMFNKDSKCTTPSLAKIGMDGWCGGFRTSKVIKEASESYQKLLKKRK